VLKAQIQKQMDLWLACESPL